jgi:glycosyltransferase involved in cell wall biosynthesis
VTPQISVIIPTFDRADLLLRAVRSVLHQTYTNLELIVVDDGSADNTQQVVAAIEDTRMRFLKQKHGGANPARNKGARAARGQLLTFLDSDDEALPDWLAKLEFEAREERIGIVFCGAETRDAQGNLESIRLPAHLGPMWNDWTGLFNDGAFLVRREVFFAAGGYAEDLMASQHSELGFRIVDHCTDHGWHYSWVDEPLVRYYSHGGRRIRKDPAAVLQGTEYILERYRDRLQRFPGDYVDYLSVAGAQATRLGHLSLAHSYSWRALRYRPISLKSLGRWAAAGLRVALDLVRQRLTSSFSGK